MTGIVVDKFQDTIYMFADGRLTGSDHGWIYSETDDKIHKLDEETLITNCGEAHLIDAVEHLIMEAKMDQESLNAIHGDGTVVIASFENIKTIDFEVLNADVDGKETTYSAKSATYKHTACPMFFGSGMECLSAAYAALDMKACKTEKEYLSKMRKIFKAASSRMSSMGPLRQTETIRLPKDKKK